MMSFSQNQVFKWRFALEEDAHTTDEEITCCDA